MHRNTRLPDAFIRFMLTILLVIIYVLLLTIHSMKTTQAKNWEAQLAFNESITEFVELGAEFSESVGEGFKKNEALFELIVDRIDQIPTFEPWDIPLEPELQAYTYGRCLSTGIDPELVFAIMDHESGFDPSAVGHNHNGTLDVGLMQINSVNWDWLAARGIDVHTVEGGIDGGILMLYELMVKYPERQALAAYAAGEAGMLRGWGYWFAGEIDEIMEGSL